ncbi:7 transmembrane receptor [Onchocerca flexuosa]|uniref:7 transmembrane receptor n=1 Tax=Onchocerca flexuosa TaxID=387005 RepID=A0A238BR20_9BILA|nr:7 transmembrane receptor [Onchocerca flexuosa]
MSWALQQIALYTVCIPIIFALCILAAFCNFLVLLTRLQIKNRSGALELTFSLAVSDIWTSIVVVASLFRNSYMPVVLGINYTSVFRTGGLLTGLFHLSTLAVYHLISITHPFDHKKLLNRYRTRLIVVLIWLLPPLILLMYFSAWPNQGYRIKNCSVVDFYDKLYFRMIISILIVALMLSTGLMYWKLLKKLNESFTKSTTTIRKHRIVVASGLIFGTFVIGWLPASLLYILTAQDMPLYQVESIWLNIFALTTLILIMIKSITNPIIYATRIPEIRHLIDEWRNNVEISRNKNKNDRRNCQEQETSFCKVEKNRSEVTN